MSTMDVVVNILIVMFGGGFVLCASLAAIGYAGIWRRRQAQKRVLAQYGQHERIVRLTDAERSAELELIREAIKR